MSQELESGLNNYSTSVYITIVRQGRSFKLKFLKDYFSLSFLRKKHDNYLDKAIEELRHITNNIVDTIAVYRPHILTTKKDLDGQEYSELMETLYYLINFKDKRIPVCPIDATRLVNDSEYLFLNGVMAMKNNHFDELTLAMSFSLKEVPRIGMSNVSDIVNNTRAEMVITEYISYVDQKNAVSSFVEQKMFLKGREDDTFKKNVGLNFLDGGDDVKYNQSSISVVITASDMGELHSVVVDAIKMFSKHGIVMAREDISLERNYYAMMPANFIFTHRLTIHDAAEAGCFCYSYTPQENDASEFLKETVLFNIGTLKSNPVPIGIDKEKTNVMIAGRENSGKTVLANYLAAAAMREMQANICIIEFNGRSRVFMDAIDGQYYRVSTERRKNNAIFNILNLNLFQRSSDVDAYLFEVITMLLSANNVLITPQISGEIQQCVDAIKEYAKTNNAFALHDVRKVFANTSFEQDIQCWHSIGRYYHLFDNRDDIFNKHKSMVIHIDETVANDSFILALVINHIFINLIQRAKKDTSPLIVILEEPFLAFGNSFFKSKLNKMIEEMARNNIYCIFRCSDIASESSTIVDFTQMINSCGLQMHFANKYSDNNYGRVFKMEKLEYMAVRTLAGYEGRNLIVKQNSNLYSCSFDLSEYPKILGILSDKGDVQAKVFQIKDGLQTDNCERWVPAYFGTFTSSETANEKRKLQQELRAIQDIKRLMES